VSDGIKYYCLNYRYILFDTHRWDFNEEKKNEISRNIEMFTSIMLLKSAFEKNMNFFSKVIDFLRENDFIDIDRLNSNSHLIIVLEYISQTRDISLQELSDIIHKTGIEGDNIMPTLAQRLEKQGLEKGIEQGIQKGLQKGIQQGIQKGMHKKAVETAVSLLKEGMPIDKTARITGLSEDEVSKLEKRG